MCRFTPFTSVSILSFALLSVIEARPWFHGPPPGWAPWHPEPDSATSSIDTASTTFNSSTSSTFSVAPVPWTLSSVGSAVSMPAAASIGLQSSAPAAAVDVSTSSLSIPTYIPTTTLTATLTVTVSNDQQIEATSIALATSFWGTTATSTISSAAAMTSSSSPSLAAAASSSMAALPSTNASTSSSGKPVFFHYMVGGIEEDHCAQDILDAQSLGVDAFALNLPLPLSTDWVANTVGYLFKHAEANNFKLFFSFDMSTGGFTDPSQLTAILQQYMSSSAHFRYNGVPLVTTFAGSSIANSAWASMKSSLGTDIILIPGFYDVTPSSSFFSTYPAMDGAFNWNSWPWRDLGKVAVQTTDDQTYLSTAKANNKAFMMGMSTMQYKHMDAAWNWYARGEENFEVRMGQVLNLQPDLLEMQTWNDAGESHYMGNIWNETLAVTPTIAAYSDAYDHKGYWQVIPAFIQAWKRGDTTTTNMVPTNGKTAQGVFWHHTLTAEADCSADPLGKPVASDNVENTITGIVLVAEGQSGLTAVVSQGGSQLGTAQLSPGFNSFAIDNMSTGSVSVEVQGGSGSVISGTGPIEVTASSNLCNYNYQVVALS